MGVYIAVVGIIVALMAVMEPKGWEKFSWIVLATLITVAEVRNIYRTDAQQQQIFGGITGSLTTTVTKLEASAGKLDEIAKSEKKVYEQVSGTGAFCFLDGHGINPGSGAVEQMNLQNSSQTIPAYCQINIDRIEGKGLASPIAPPKDNFELAPGGGEALQGFRLPLGEYRVYIETKNGESFYENVLISKDKQTQQALIEWFVYDLRRKKVVRRTAPHA